MTNEIIGAPPVPLEGVDPVAYPYQFYPYLYEDYVPPTAEPVPEPTPKPTPEPVQNPVISVGELLEMLQNEQATQSLTEEEPTALTPGDTVAVELDPGSLAVVEAVKGVKNELVLISDQLAEIQLAGDRPLLTTPFEDYTVSEGLLLSLLLAAFLSVCYKLLKGGFLWLRS